MDAQTCILTRRSVRQFTDQPVPHELLEDVVALAAYAPSWKNTQISRYLAIEDPAMRETIASEYCLAGANNPAAIIRSAPLLVAQTFVKNRCGYERLAVLRLRHRRSDLLPGCPRPGSGYRDYGRV